MRTHGRRRTLVTQWRTFVSVFFQLNRPTQDSCTCSTFPVCSVPARHVLNLTHLPSKHMLSRTPSLLRVANPPRSHSLLSRSSDLTHHVICAPGGCQPEGARSECRRHPKRVPKSTSLRKTSAPQTSTRKLRRETSAESECQEAQTFRRHGHRKRRQGNSEVGVLRLPPTRAVHNDVLRS
jgi:hypothetical protein